MYNFSNQFSNNPMLLLNNLNTMQRTDKQTNPFLFQLTYTQIKNSGHYLYINAFFILVQFCLLLFKLYFLINLTVLESLSPPYTTIFIIMVVMFGLFALLTIFSYHFQLLNTIWVYFLIFLQSVQVVFIELTISCFKSHGWCKGDPKYQLSALLIFFIFAFIIYLRSHCYCPFYDCSNPLAMNCGRSVLYMFVYSILISLATDELILPSQNASKQLSFLLTCALYAVCSNPSYISPALARIYSVCCMGLVWTSGVIWATPILQTLFNQTTDNTSAFWFCWGYSYPVVLGLGFVQTSYLTKGYRWKDLFLVSKNDDLRCLYLQTTQLVKYMQVVRKSQLKSNSTQFKIIWELIKTHNSKCNDLDCALKSLEELRIERGDEMMEQKRFNKTLQKTFEYCLTLLVRQKDIFPNKIELSIEIANYELEVFHLRTKGLQLYNREYSKPGMGKQQLWGIFYLKKKIEGFDTTGQVRVKGQSQQDISSFKHDIEVSVSMLAEFWYFLSDPKCNLKKLYDLANVLFPMKIKVDKTWKMIRQFKSIQCYNLYAKYLIKMFNDKEKGLKILEEAHKLEVENNEKAEILAGNEASLNQEHGVIFLQFDGKNSGIMYQVNTACELIFGYNKGELQGRKVNDIMPKVYSIHHDKILQHYQQTNRPKMMNKQRVIWGKSKDGYLFPFTICIKPVRNYYSQTSEVYASVKRDLWIRESAFFFTDSDLNLSDISASMLGIFPNLHGRIHLKKKVPIQEVAPGFQKVKDRVIYQKESYDFTVERVFTVCQGQEYTQKLMLSLTGEQVTVNVSGAIGFYFKLLKNSGASNSYQPNNNSSSNYKEANADASNSYWMKRENDFRFIAAVQDTGTELVKKSAMIYHGGLVLENNQTRSLIQSRIQSSFEKTKLQVNQEHEAFEQIDYGKDIKMRRLMGTAIRQIHEISQESDQNNNVGNNDNQEEQNAEMVKPSQLNSILSRQNGNKNINLLKLLTIIILCLSTLLSIFQYILTYSNSNSLVSALNTISAQNSLQAQIMYINLYSNLYSLNMINNADVTNLKAEINELDTLSASVSNAINTHLTYSDGSNQTMILSFAIDKLISQAQLLAAAPTVSSSDANLFFVQYNSVNGLQQGCQQALSKQRSTLMSTNDSVITTYIIYLAISTSVFLLILIFKNLILRAVLKKKAEILNVFFEIPRYACSSIQKECQRFVQRLTMDDQEEEQFQFDNQVQEEEQANKRYSKQKKRAIMGQEKTGTTFILVSLGLLVFLLIYPILVIILAKTSYSDQQYSFTSVSEIMSFQKEMSKMMSFLDTSNSRPNFPLGMATNASQVSATHYAYLSQLLVSIQEDLYYLGDILSTDYVKNYNALFFKNLCINNATCNDTYGQSNGLNALVFYYFDYMVGKYKQYSTTKAQIAPNSTVIQKQQTLRLLMKKYWRQFQAVLLSGTEDFINTNDPILFGVMLTVCIVNMTVLMYLWIRFYNSLGQKIIATQYILTFIPIDEINKNPKIAKYIKDQVLRAQ